MLKSFTYDSVHLAPKEQIGLHTQDSWELSYIIKGSGSRLIGERTEPFNRGEVVLIPPGIPHCWYFDGADTDNRGRIANITLIFTNALLDRLVAVFPEFKESVEALKNLENAVKLGPRKTEAIIPILEDMRAQDDEKRVTSLLGIIPILASPGYDRVIGEKTEINKEQERLNAVRIYVICNATRDISLEDVAKHVGMNKSAFCVFFKKAAGQTFINYLNEYRVELACKHLEQNKLNISEICFKCGFNSVPYFNRIFKRYKLCSPKEFRRGRGY